MVKIQTIALLSLASTVLAAPTWWEQWTLNKAKDVAHRFLPHSQDKRLVQTAENMDPVWTTEEERLDMIKNKMGFMDITDHQDFDARLHVNVKKPLPKGAHHQEKYERYVGQLSAASMESETGRESARWLYKQISDLIEEAAISSDISIRKFEHDWDQFSIIVIGAHQDSVNAWFPYFGRSPGADDDGSGTVTILEVFRALINTGFHPDRPVEFHWYSAEENDMTGYVGTKFDESYGVVTDHVDPELTELIKEYAREYGDIAVRETKCGYACSDHASWAKYGYRSAFAIEGDFSDISPYIHGQEDDVSHIDFNHMKEFAKLTLGFAIELGHLAAESTMKNI
ncbi:Leucine aminopeptidase 1 [Mortierella sp. AD011]|nr:Leucine aminopeptidase 1 [Mortierella sp. AD011]